MPNRKSLRFDLTDAIPELPGEDRPDAQDQLAELWDKLIFSVGRQADELINSISSRPPGQQYATLGESETLFNLTNCFISLQKTHKSKSAPLKRWEQLRRSVIKSAATSQVPYAEPQQAPAPPVSHAPETQPAPIAP